MPECADLVEVEFLQEAKERGYNIPVLKNQQCHKIFLFTWEVLLQKQSPI
jgi:hypothetical protein